MFRTAAVAVLSILFLTGAKLKPPTDQELYESPATGQIPVCTIKSKQVSSLPIYERPYGKPVTELRRGVKVRAFYHHTIAGKVWAHIALDDHPWWGLWGYVLGAHLSCGGPPSKAYDALETCLVRTPDSSQLQVHSDTMDKIEALISSGDRVVLQPRENGEDRIIKDGQDYVWIERTINDNPLGYVLADRLTCREDED